MSGAGTTALRVAAWVLASALSAFTILTAGWAAAAAVFAAVGAL